MASAMIEAPRAPQAEEESAIGEGQQYLTFTLGEESYALPIARVREIVEFHVLTEVPMMPAFLCGVTNLRGAVIPVIDLLARFGKGAVVRGKRTCVVVVEVESEEGPQGLGILVNSVDRVLPVPAADISARPAFGTSIRPDFIESLLEIEGGFVPNLDIQQVLSLQEMMELAQAWSARSGA